MGHDIIRINNEEKWHLNRSKGIGGSDAASILGVNPWKTNLDLWREKTGRKKADDVSNVDAVVYGKKAEEYLRQLFLLDYPQYKLNYAPYDIHCNHDYEFIRGTFDGELIDNGVKGIFECKTGTIKQKSDWLKWEKKIPQNYFCQVLHYFAIDEDYKFCKLKAQLKYIEPETCETVLTTKHYLINRDDYKADIEYLIEEEIKFWEYVKADKEPPLKLPNI